MGLFKYILGYFYYHFIEVKVIQGSRWSYWIFTLKNVLYRLFNKRLIYTFKEDTIIQNRFGKIFLLKNADIANCLSHKDIIPFLKISPQFSLAIDIGANIGATALVLNKKNPHLKKIYAIEAIPEVTAILKKNIEINHLVKKITPVSLAISDTHQDKNFFYNTRNSALSFMDEDIDIKKILKKYSKNNVLGKGVYFVEDFKKIKIPCIRLDDFIKKNKIQCHQIGMIKIDVEGAEFEVMQGGLKTLAKLQSQSKVIVEIFDSSPHGEEIKDFFKKNNFTSLKLTDADYCFTKN